MQRGKLLCYVFNGSLPYGSSVVRRHKAYDTTMMVYGYADGVNNGISRSSRARSGVQIVAAAGKAVAFSLRVKVRDPTPFKLACGKM